jgi:hypothetical protein
MKKLPWPRIFAIIAVALIIVGMAPICWLFWDAFTDNSRPLSVTLPLNMGEYVSPEFKTSSSDAYVIQIELMDTANRSIDLNPDAVLDLDWSIVDQSGAILAQGSQNAPIRDANNVNLGEFQPKRSIRQRLIIDKHAVIAEPAGTQVTLQINSTEDPEGFAFGLIRFSEWAFVVAGPGAIILLVLLVQIARRSSRGTPSRTPETP